MSALGFFWSAIVSVSGRPADALRAFALARAAFDGMGTETETHSTVVTKRKGDGFSSVVLNLIQN